MTWLPSLALAGTLVLSPGFSPRLSPTLAAAHAPATPDTTARTAQKAKPAGKVLATHATSGVVKSIDATSLVITRGTKHATTESFRLSAATEKKGELTAGARVEVRYRNEGGRHVATAVRVK